MARQPRKASRSRKETEQPVSPTADNGTRETQLGITGPGTTGRFLVLLREDVADAGAAMLSQLSGLKVASAADFEGSAAPEDLGGADAVWFPQLGVCVMDAQPDQIQALRATTAGDTGVLAVEPERVVYAIQDGPMTEPGMLGFASGLGAQNASLEYLRGYRDAVNHLYDKLTGTVAEEVAAEAAPVFAETELTWGLQATKVPASRFTGRGIRVAVLDTGLDLAHPDFTGRRITAQSFIEGEPAQDGHGHGTHCIGTACGPRRPGTLPRYGVAYEAEIFAGKVLSNQGSGGDGGILAGIQWAITNGCAIVSMSLGARVQPGQPFSQVFEQAARRALTAGTLIIAAAGNESRRPQEIAPVGHPANCPSIVAVGAIDRRMQV